jgi:hypothetical protein
MATRGRYVTYAAIPDSSGVIHACYANSGGLRVIDTQTSPAQSCRPNEQPLDWSQAGGPGSGDEVASGVIGLAAGETRTVVQKGPFAITGSCADLGGGRIQVEVDFRSNEAGTVYAGVEPPLAANTPFRLFTRANTVEEWETTFALVTAPSGVSAWLAASAGVHTFGSDCAVSAIGVGKPG